MRRLASAALDEARRLRDDWISLSLELTRLESPSREPETQGPVLDLLTDRLEAVDMEVTRWTGATSGGGLLASPRDRSPGGPWQLLVGHCDTVWPRGTIAEMPAAMEDGVLRGPGIYDMKAGLAQTVVALRIARDLERTPEVLPVVLVTSDEEVGSRDALRHLRRLGRLAERAFVLEPSLGPEGRLKTARKGVGHFRVRVRGRAAHAGLDPEEGISAILELSHVIQDLFALNDPDRGITVNVGTVDGGLRSNVVAPESTADVDVRVLTSEDGATMEAAIHGLQPTVPGVSLEVEGTIGRPPMERTPHNRRLWRLARNLGKSLGLDLEEATAGGASDGNHLSRHTATLDGLGAVGGGAHATHEHVAIEPSLDRVALLALLLLAPSLARRETADRDGHAVEAAP